MKAYVWRNGQVEFSETVPHGALVIAEGEGKEFIENIQIKCRRAYPHFVDGIRQAQIYLLPGLPEAENDREAFLAMGKFRAWISSLKGVTVPELD